METAITIASFALLWLASGGLLTHGYIHGLRHDRPSFLHEPTPLKVTLSCLLIQFRYQIYYFLLRRQKGLTPFVQSSIFFLIVWGVQFWICMVASHWIASLV